MSEHVGAICLAYESQRLEYTDKIIIQCMHRNVNNDPRSACSRRKNKAGERKKGGSERERGKGEGKEKGRRQASLVDII